MDEPIWPPDDIVVGPREDERTGRENGNGRATDDHVGSPWAQPPGTAEPFSGTMPGSAPFSGRPINGESESLPRPHTDPEIPTQRVVPAPPPAQLDVSTQRVVPAPPPAQPDPLDASTQRVMPAPPQPRSPGDTESPLGFPASRPQPPPTVDPLIGSALAPPVGPALDGGPDLAHQPTSGQPQNAAYGAVLDPGLGGPPQAPPYDPAQVGSPYDPAHGGPARPPYDPGQAGGPYDPAHGGPAPYDPAHGGPAPYDPAYGGPAPYDPAHGGPAPYDPAYSGPAQPYDPALAPGPAHPYDPAHGGAAAQPYDPTQTGGPAQAYDPAQGVPAQPYDPIQTGGPHAYDPTQTGGPHAYDPTQTGRLAHAYDPANAGPPAPAYDPANAGPPGPYGDSAQPYDPAHAAGQPPPAYGPPPGAIPQQWSSQHGYGPPPQPSAPPATKERPDGPTPTADDFARRRATRPSDPVATMGMRGVITKGTLGLVTLAPGRHEQEYRHDVEMVRRNFGGLRQVTVVNPKGGAGKTVAVLLLAMTFGQKRGGYVLAWDNNETQGTLGMRALQDFHTRTVRDLLRDLDHFRGAQGRVGDLSQYVRAQGEGMFDVLASDESATAGEMLNAHSFGEIREVVSRFYKLIMVDTGNNVRAQNWQAAIDATDQLVVTMSGRNDSAETAARMLDHLEQQGRHRLVRQAVTVVSMPPSRRDLDIPAISRHFAARTRTVLLAPYERFIDSGEPIRYPQLSSATRNAWLKIASAVAEGL